MKYLLAFLISTSAFAEGPLPFWAEKISYVDGDRFFFVGVATGQPSVEVGRSKALDNGRWELASATNSKDLNGLIIQTERNLEIKEPGGGYTVYRLMFVKTQDLSELAAKHR